MSKQSFRKVFVLLTAATFLLGGFFVAQSVHAADPLAIPEQCAGATPSLTVTQQITEADTGRHGTWATDTFTETVDVYPATDGVNAFCAVGTIASGTGTFVTTGPNSPENGVALPAGITGTITGGETWIFPSGTTLLQTGPTFIATPVNNPAIDSQFSNWQNEVFGSTVGANTYFFNYVVDGNAANNWTNAGSGNLGDIYPVFNVTSNTGYGTIQDAINNAASSGDTINVTAGTYDPFKVISKNLTITGTGTPIIRGALDVSTDVTLPRFSGKVTKAVVLIKNSTVNLNGLDIEGDELVTPGTNNFGFALIYENSNGVVDNITASPNDDVSSTPDITMFGTTGIGIWKYNSADAMDVTIQNSTVKLFGNMGITVWNGAKAQIENNKIIGQVYSEIEKEIYGINVDDTFYTKSLGDITEVTITGNEIYNCDNTVSPDDPRDQAAALHLNASLEYDNGGLVTPEAKITITNNILHDNRIGIYVVHGSPANTYANSNSIYNSRLYGVASKPDVSDESVEFNAENNYWGSTDGPAEGAVSSNVDFSPWYSDQDKTSLGYTTATSDGKTTATVDTTTTLSGTDINNNVGVTAEIPLGTTVTSSGSSWNGVISAPTTTNVTLTIPGNTVEATSAIAVGSSDFDLTFDKAVKLTFANQASKRVGWYNAAGTFTEITATCADNTQTTNDDGLGEGESCKINSIPDLVVWTRHFSTFVTYTQTPVHGNSGSIRRFDRADSGMRQ